MENRVRKFTSSTKVVAGGPGSAGIWCAPDPQTGKYVLKYCKDSATVASGLTVDTPDAEQVAAVGASVKTHQLTFTETAGAGVWTGTVPMAAGATLLDIIVNGIALWTSQTSATLIAGITGGDDDAYFTAVDLKATDLLAGESLSFNLAGGKAGASIANSQVSPRYFATASSIAVKVTKVGSTGTAGRTNVTVVWSEPTAAFTTAATKV